MKYFTIYNVLTGEIVNSGEVSRDSDYDLQPLPYGCTIMEAQSHPNLHYVDKGRVMDKGSAPENHYFDYKQKRWLLDQSRALASINRIRDGLLLESDWTQLPDCPLSILKQKQWRIYRQKLRDLDKSDLANVVFPKKPD